MIKRATWKLDSEEVNQHGNCVGVYIAERDGTRVLQTFVNCGFDEDQARANAKHIVNAVNNHDALVAAVRAFVKYDGATYDYKKTGVQMMMNYDDAIEKAREVLAELEKSKS